MDQQYTTIAINSKRLSTKYPNIIELWEKYINIKKKLFVESMQDCEKVVEKLDLNECDDLEKKQILLMYLLAK
jgi:hypothetical protein